MSTKRKTGVQKRSEKLPKPIPIPIPIPIQKGSSTTFRLTCSFCGTPQNQVRHLVAGKGGYICDSCTEIAWACVMDAIKAWDRVCTHCGERFGDHVVEPPHVLDAGIDSHGATVTAACPGFVPRS